MSRQIIGDKEKYENLDPRIKSMANKGKREIPTIIAELKGHGQVAKTTKIK